MRSAQRQRMIPKRRPWTRRSNAIDEQLARVKADQERKTEPPVDPAEIRSRLAALQRALSILESLRSWKPALDGTAGAARLRGSGRYRGGEWAARQIVGRNRRRAFEARHS